MQSDGKVEAQDIHHFYYDICYRGEAIPRANFQDQITKSEFENYYQKNKGPLGKWMKDLLKDYKEIEEACENASANDRLHPKGKEKDRLDFPPEILKEIEELKLSPAIAQDFRVSYEKLKNNPKEKMELNEKLLSILEKNKIKRLLGNKIISSAMSNGQVTLPGFIRIMAILTQEKYEKQRLDLLFNIYHNNGKIEK